MIRIPISNKLRDLLYDEIDQYVCNHTSDGKWPSFARILFSCFI